MGDSTPAPSRSPLAASHQDPHISAIQQFLTENPQPPNLFRQVTQETQNLALQIAHNLRFQHNWTDIKIHYYASHSAHLNSRPILSGLPPQRLYVHPDEQIEILQRQRERGRAGWPTEEVQVEREWVLPSHLRENWTLRRLGEVFDGLAVVPGEDEGRSLFRGGNGHGHGKEGGGEGARTAEPGVASLLSAVHDGSSDAELLDADAAARQMTSAAAAPETTATTTQTRMNTNTNTNTDTDRGANPWRTRQPKRVLLATLDDDSTVVYYIVHDGIVKPRQN